MNAPDPRLFSEESNQLGALTDGSGASYHWLDYVLDPERLDLDAAYPRITAGSWFALASGEEGQGSPALPGYVELYRAERVTQVSRTDFGLSARITRLTPDTDEHLTAARYGLRETLVLAQSEPLSPVARPLPFPVYGDQLTLDLSKKPGPRGDRQRNIPDAAP